MICENCKSEHDGTYGSGRFCCKSCASSFSTKIKRKEINKKVSTKLKGKRWIDGNSHQICEYGCGNLAKYQLKNDRWCCSQYCNSCPAIKKKCSIGIKKAYKTGKIDKYKHTKESLEKMVASWKQTYKDKVDSTAFDKLPLATRKTLVLEEQEGKCLHCGISNWNDKPIVLELDHIDGDNQNNKRNNMRFLCPNCHSQTASFRGRNIAISGGQTKVSDKELIEAIKITDNPRQALIKCNLTPKGGNYKRVYKLMENLCITKQQKIKRTIKK